MTVGELLARYAELLNNDGPDSVSAQAMINDYAHNDEFVELAALCRKLKTALVLPTETGIYHPSK